MRLHQQKIQAKKTTILPALFNPQGISGKCNRNTRTSAEFASRDQFVIITFQNKADGENNSKSWFLNCCRNPQHIEWRFLWSSDVLSTWVWSSTGTHMKDAAASHLQRARIICLFLHLSLPVFTVSSWGRWEGDSQRSAFSFHSRLQRTGDAWHAQHKKVTIFKLVIQKCLLVLLLAGLTKGMIQPVISSWKHLLF